MKYKKIINSDQYNEYSNIHEKLSYDNYEKHRDEIELIQILLDEYERRTNPNPVDLDPVETIDYLLQENEISKSELARKLKVSRQLISDILSYRRNISKQMAMKLSNHFKLAPIAFSRSYQLKKKVKQLA